MLDLQGPKLRVGEFDGGRIHLRAGDAFRLDLSKELGTKHRVPLPHPEIFAALKPKTDLLVDDGKIRLRVVRCGLDFAETKVITGGEVSDHKGVNVPSASYSSNLVYGVGKRAAYPGDCCSHHLT